MPTFLQIEQRDVEFLALGALSLGHEDVLGIKAAMLPTVPMHPGQDTGEGRQETFMLSLAQLATTAFRVPMIEVLIAFQRGAHQQGAPTALGLPGIAEQQVRDLNAQLAKGQQRISFTQGGGTPQGMTQAAVKVADLSLDVGQGAVGKP
ncbi:hypothetical protein SB5_21245 [Pseudomonas oryzihabitans]|nr:hypothetical protein SB5_21245 [Pseudomonas psychrotolerans]KTT64856.1 hypothetical protein NS383_12340 [Pseudomonas psychrotolerans]